MTSGIALWREARLMKFYRCYFLSASNAIKGVAEFRCRDDAEALAQSRDQLKTQPLHHGFELWEGSRRIHREFAADTITDGASKTGK
jgi:hypothetical protein